MRDKSDIKQITDLKGKRMAWDYGGHAINQTWQSAVMETAGLKAADVAQVRVSNLNDGVRAVPEAKVDASFTAVGIGVVEEANAMEPIRADYFGTKAFATIQGMSRSVQTVGTFMGPIIAGIFYDLTKSYMIVFALFAAVSLVAVGAMFLAKAPNGSTAPARA